MNEIQQGSPPESDFRPPPKPLLSRFSGSTVGLVGAVLAGVFALIAAFSPILLS